MKPIEDMFGKSESYVFSVLEEVGEIQYSMISDEKNDAQEYLMKIFQ